VSDRYVGVWRQTPLSLSLRGLDVEVEGSGEVWVLEMAVLGLEFASARARAAPRSRASARTGKGNGAPRGRSCVSLRASSRDQQDEVSKMRRKLDKDYMEGKIEEAVQGE